MMKSPTLAEVKRIVRAWVRANWPDAKHVSLTSWGSHGGSEEEIDLMGPPTAEPWFSNDLPFPPSTMTREEVLTRLAELSAS